MKPSPVAAPTISHGGKLAGRCICGVVEGYRGHRKTKWCDVREGSSELRSVAIALNRKEISVEGPRTGNEAGADA